MVPRSIGLNLLTPAAFALSIVCVHLGQENDMTLANFVGSMATLGLMVALPLYFWFNYAVGDLLRSPTVVPYFQSHVGDIHTFSNGRFLARRIEELDERARLLEVAPLSEFGWNDDFDGEQLTWHQPADGLVTVVALRDSLRRETSDGPEHEGLLHDLERFAHALARAGERQIPFCLLVRHGDSTNAQEWAMRKGTCF